MSNMMEVELFVIQDINFMGPLSLYGYKYIFIVVHYLSK